MNIWQAIEELKTSIETANDIVALEIPWQYKYALVFSQYVSGEIETHLTDLNLDLDYYNPDTSYKEDVLAYVGALDELARGLVSGKSEATSDE